MSTNPTRDQLLLKDELEKNIKADRTTMAISNPPEADRLLVLAYF
jgi:hypothetical protein